MTSMAPGALIITIANQKGGVGKTTLTMNLGHALSDLGYRVCLIDSDPQANLTSYLGLSPGQGIYTELRTLDEVYLSKRAFNEEFYAQTLARAECGVDAVAADGNLSGVEHYLFTRPDRELVLERFLHGLKSRYDFILIDTPPSLNLLTINALAASRFVLTPIQPEFFSLEGIVKIRASIEQIRSRYNEDLELLGVVANHVSPRRKLTTEVMDVLRRDLGPLLFETVIHDNASVTESTGHAQSVLSYDRRSKGAQDFKAFASELCGRLYSNTSLRFELKSHEHVPVQENQPQENRI